MANPFTIEIFSTSGDPVGIRTIQKSNWSGMGVVFPRESVLEVIKELNSDRPGVYMLVGDLAEETIYIGEADPVSTRLKQHLQKDWSWGVFFVDSHGLGKTEIRFLESELIRIALENDTAILMNKVAPAKPSMTPQAQAAANVFLNEMLLILPMIGIRAFAKPRIKSVKNTAGLVKPLKNQTAGSWDTIVIPAREEGFRSVFLGRNCWFAIRINAKEIPKFKYIAAYQVAPVSAITHIAEVKEIVPYQNSGKYLVKFKAKAKALENPIKLEKGKAGSQPQSPRYTTYNQILKAKSLEELWI